MVDLRVEVIGYALVYGNCLFYFGVECLLLHVFVYLGFDGLFESFVYRVTHMFSNILSLMWLSDSSCAIKVISWSRCSFKMSFCSIDSLFIELMCIRSWIVALAGSCVIIYIILSPTRLLNYSSTLSSFSFPFFVRLSSSGSF